MELTHLDKETTDGTVRNLDALYKLFPSCFTEAQDAVSGDMRRVVDWGKLRELLGEYVEDGEPEKYDFTWVGKRAAQREAAAPCRKTLRPCKEESVDWDTTQNLYIEGDNLEVLKLLQNSYMGKVKMIYIDPPYNTGNDFVYHDDFAQSAEEYDEHNLDDEGNRFRKNTDSNGRFHSDWCSMIYARLMVARSLLTEDGIIFISIDDNEVKNLRNICNEVFGESNFVAQIIWKNKFGSGALTAGFIGVHEYILVYSRNNLQNITRTLTEQERENYNKTRDSKFATRGGYVTQPLAVTTFGDRPNLRYPVNYKGQEIWPKKQWVWEKQRMMSAIENDEVVFNLQKDGTYNLRSKKYLIDESGRERRGKPTTLYSDVYTQNGTEDIRNLFSSLVFDYTKPVELIKYLVGLELNNKPSTEDVILDFFSGSATTAHAVMQLNAEDGSNRKFIMVQLPEETAEDSEAYKAGYKNICEIGKERIRRAGKKIKEELRAKQGNLFSPKGEPEGAFDIGFRVLKCDESNYKPVAFAPKDYTQESLDMFLDNIKEERTGLDLLFDCMMRWGLELSLPYDTQKVDGCTIFNVDEGNLVACFDGVVTSAVIDAIAETHPLRVVFRDSSFTEAAQKMNLFELFKQKCGWTDQEVQKNVRVI